MKFISLREIILNSKKPAGRGGGGNLLQTTAIQGAGGGGFIKTKDTNDWRGSLHRHYWPFWPFKTRENPKNIISLINITRSGEFRSLTCLCELNNTHEGNSKIYKLYSKSINSTTQDVGRTQKLGGYPTTFNDVICALSKHSRCFLLPRSCRNFDPWKLGQSWTTGHITWLQGLLLLKLFSRFCSHELAGWTVG